MPEEIKYVSQYKTQKITKPEDIAGDFLDTERTAAMLNLIEFVRANKIGIQWASGNSWALIYKSKRLGHLKIYDAFMRAPIFNGTWYFCHKRDYLERYYSMEDGDFKRFIFDNIYAKNCGNCICTGANPNEQKAGYMNPTECGC